MGTRAGRSQVTRVSLLKIYRVLLGTFGPQGWWPAQSPFEVMVGAILVQNTNWKNAERAIDHLKRKRLLTPRNLHALSVRALAAQIRPAGYFNVKARRLKNFLAFFVDRYQGSVKKMRAQKKEDLRAQLLAVKGIGPETADAILLYALDKPLFVIDNYTKRVFSRHGIFPQDVPYPEAQQVFHRYLSCDAKLYNEYHALLVRLAKEFCRARPLCGRCPLNILKSTKPRRFA